MTATWLFLRGTPLISVDSFGFLISEFEYNTLTGSVEQSFHTKAGDKSYTNFALNNADKFLVELQSYLSYPHGLTKLFHAAIPDSSEGERFFIFILFFTNTVLRNCFKL